MTTRIAVGDARRILKMFPAESINTCITSPPYWLKRNYSGGPCELGKEPTINAYIGNLLTVIDEVQRVLRPNGTLWLNVGDSYSTHSGRSGDNCCTERGAVPDVSSGKVLIKSHELPHKSLCLIPYRVAIALQERGWIVRNVIIWHKPDAMPESVQDRFTVDYEPVFLCAKNPKYFFQQQLREYSSGSLKRLKGGVGNTTRPSPATISAKNLQVPGRTTNSMHLARANGNGRDVFNPAGANLRCVWTIPTAGYNGAHFAVMPERLVEICVDAGCPQGGTVLDPFLGSGTTGLVAERLERDFYGIELNPQYAQQATERIRAARRTKASTLVGDESCVGDLGNATTAYEICDTGMA